jgi:hypothetical protein
MHDNKELLQAGILRVQIAEVLLFSHAVNEQLNSIRQLLAQVLDEPPPIRFVGAGPDTTFAIIDDLANMEARLIYKLEPRLRDFPEDDPECPRN